MLHAVYATVAETFAATLKLSSRNKMHSVAAFFVEIQVFEVLYALNFVCDTTC